MLPAYVINLDRDQERLERFTAMMAAENWPWTRFSAVSGDNPRFGELRERYLRPFNWLTQGEVGCLLSHVLLWEQLVASDMERMVVFEDDAATHVTGVPAMIEELYQELERMGRPEPDILYLGKCLDNCAGYRPVWGHVYESTHPLCLHAYVITRVGAAKLLARAPYSVAIDMVTIAAIEDGAITAFAFHPSLYFQDVFHSQSNLRSSTINHTLECLTTHQHIPNQVWWQVVGIVLVLVLAATLFFHQ